MPNQYAPDSARLFIRIPQAWKERLERVAREKNALDPAGNYSVNSIVRAAIMETVVRLEEEIARAKAAKNGR
jgi:hypothetical protein